MSIIEFNTVEGRKTLSLPALQPLGAFTFDGVILALWKRGLDTVDISKALGARDFPESRVANRLAALRDADKL